MLLETTSDPEHAVKTSKRDGAGDGDRTRDPKLGKLVLCQLSYTRL